MTTLRLWLFCIVLCAGRLSAATYFVAVTGSDSAAGTIDNPFRTLPKAVTVSIAGDTIYVRGGTYSIATTITISKSGTSLAYFHLYAYPGERPLLDFSPMAISSSNRGIKLNGSFWHVKGFDIHKAGDNGMFVGGSNNIIEFCSFFENSDTGLQLGSGASNNEVINCDSFDNVDPGQGNADGFAPKLDVGTGNYFYGCRSWQNSDDGWDGYMRGANNVSTTLENCWTFKNGYLKDGTPSTGNGNGFKMGGSDLRDLEHNMTLIHCLAFDNRVKGFDQNNNKGSMTLLNGSAYRNGTNYSISQALDSGKVLTVINCLAYGAYGSIGSFAIQQTNSWMPGFSVGASDFVSLDTSGVRGPRKPDGSLPDVQFLHLAEGSDLIDTGTDIGLPYEGTAPDLGCFEFSPSNSVARETALPITVRLAQNYPNPFNPSTTIEYEIPRAVHVTLALFNVIGQQVATLVDQDQTAGPHVVKLDAGRLSGGIYFYRLQAGSISLTKSMLLVK